MAAYCRGGVETALIVEDDVVFLAYAPGVAVALVEQGLLDKLDLRRADPTLLRLGWAAGPDHRKTQQIVIKADVVRMSNPCHALNRGMAAKLLETFEKIDTTVDGFVHKRVGPTVANFTVFPPLVSDLSWSVGAVESLIHPKPIRVAYLQKHHPDRTEEIKAAKLALRQHDDHIVYRPILTIGHPGFGSRYMSELFKAYGLDVGCDRIGKDGISSWKFAVEDACLASTHDTLSALRRNMYFGAVIHIVRDPRTAIPAIVREHRESEAPYAFCRTHVLEAFGVDLDAARSEVEKAALSYLYWNELIERQRVDVRVRIEEAEDTIRDFLAARNLFFSADGTETPPSVDVGDDQLDQAKVPTQPRVSDEDWRSIGDSLKTEINEMCQRFGYLPFFGTH